MRALTPSLATARAVSGGLHSLARGRTLLAVIAIAFGIALGYAVELINRAAVNELATGLATLSGDADIDVRGPRNGFDEALYPLLAKLDGVAVASPVIETTVTIRDRDTPLTIVGVDVFRATAITPALVGVDRDKLDALRSDALFPSAAAASWLGVREGDTVDVATGRTTLKLRVAGTSRGGSSLRYAVMDIAAVQDAFDSHGRLTRIDLRAAPGTDVADLARRVQALLPPGVVAAPPQAGMAAAARLSRAYRVNLNVLALVALFTGSMLVFATQSLSVARRRPQFALLRTLGLRRRELVGLVIAEAAVLGCVAAIGGIVAGHALAFIALREFGPDLGAGFFRARAVALGVEPIPIVAFAVLGLLAAIGGSALPAREAASAAPAAALKATDAEVMRTGPHWPAWTLIAAGAVASFLPAIDGLPIFGYGAIALIVIGGILAMPQVATVALHAIGKPTRVSARLAIAYMRASPARVAATLAAMVASVALMAAMAIMVTSFRQSLDDWLTVMLPADIYVRTASDSVAFARADREALEQIRGVATIEYLRATSLWLSPAMPRVTLLARDVDRDDAATRLALVGDALHVPAAAPPPVWISEPVADATAVIPGATMTLPIAGRASTFTVAGIWRDYVRQQGAVVIERSRYVALTGDDAVNEATLWLDAGADSAAVRADVARVVGDGRVVTTPAELRKLSLAAFDRTFAVTYALEAAAVLIGIVGLSAALVAQTLGRSREFGMLRHIGMTRGELRRMVAVEGATLAGLGVAWGLALGFAISLILVNVVNRQSFHWGMALHVPWRSLTLLAVALVALATLTAHLSARTATSISAVRAVRDDW